MKSQDWDHARQVMVDRQIAGRDIKSPLVIAAMRKVPREQFVPEKMRQYAFDDGPLPIGDDQTISQPYIVAYMIDLLGLQGGEKALEIGTGSGYAAAVLAEIAGHVFTVERIPRLARTADQRLQSLGYTNISVRTADGTLGWPEEAPFDAIVVAAAPPEIPQPLKSQLKIGGRLVIPVGRESRTQGLVRVTRVAADNYQTEHFGGVRFVPLIAENHPETDRV